jgi:hypothetical protein
MSSEEIYKKIESIYNSKKGKGFITHLLRSFFPIDKAQYAFFNEENKEYVCCITGQKLGTKEDMWNETMGEKGRAALMDHLKAMSTAMLNDGEYVPPESVVEIRKNIKQMAIVSEKSNKCLSEEAFKQLQNFYFTEILKDNKHINWVANNERAKKFVNKAKKDGFIKNKREEKTIHKTFENSPLKKSDKERLMEIRKRMGN